MPGSAKLEFNKGVETLELRCIALLCFFFSFFVFHPFFKVYQANR